MRWTTAITILAVETRSESATRGSRIDLDQVSEITHQELGMGSQLPGFASLIEPRPTNRLIASNQTTGRHAPAGLGRDHTLWFSFGSALNEALDGRPRRLEDNVEDPGGGEL